MQYTPNYNFDLPEENDEMETATRTALDDNFTDLDTLLKDIEDDIDDIQGDISDLDAKTGDDIPFESGSQDSISDKITNLDNSVGTKPSGETDTLWDKIGILSNYSTTEQVIGKWIDGKPLYRRVITGTLPNSENVFTTLWNTTDWNIDVIIGLDGIATNGNEFQPFNCYRDSYAKQFELWLRGSKTAITSSFGSTFIGNQFIIVVKYTKTTD